jgi:hypothetical protein
MPNMQIETHGWRVAGDVDSVATAIVELRMPIRPLPPVVCYGDLERGRQIAGSWKLLDHLAPADAEIVARAIAQGIAEGRRHGLEFAQGGPQRSPEGGSGRQEAAAGQER